MPAKRLFLLVLLIYLALATAYSVAVPLAEAPDEADHYAYLRYLGRNRTLPEGPRITQGKHPPLYHATAAVLTNWTGLGIDFLRANPDALPFGPGKSPNLFVHTALESFPWRDGPLAMHLARLWSVLLGGVTLWATWMLGMEVFSRRPAVGLVAASFLAGLPGFLFISGSINNDNAAGALGALVLLLCARTVNRGLSWRRTALLGLILGLGLLSKVGTLALWPLVAVAVGGAWWLDDKGPRLAWTFLGHLLLAWGLGLLLAGPWLLRNMGLYGDPLAWDLVRATVDERLEPLDLTALGWLLRGHHRTLWGSFGGAGQVQLPTWAYLLAAGFTGAVLVGIVLYMNGRGQAEGEKERARRKGGEKRGNGADNIPPSPLTPSASLLLLALAPLLIFASIVRYSAIALGTDQARLMWPALAAIAVWVGIGATGLADWIALKARGIRRADDVRLAGGFLVGMASLALLVLIGLIRPAFAPPPPLPETTVSGGQPQATFGESLQLLAVDLPEETLAVGEPVPARLIWRATRPIAEDLRPTLRLVHSDGWLAAEWSHAPAGGRYATDLWRPGEAIADEYLVAPEPSSPGTYQVELGVRPLGGDWLQIASQAETKPFVTVGQVIYR